MTMGADTEQTEAAMADDLAVTKKKPRHGHAPKGRTSPTYRAWSGMVYRTTNIKYQDYPRYGGRGIVVCERWRSFPNFLADMGEKPTAGLTLDRIDNDGNYEPGNCRWATTREQNRNYSRCQLTEEMVRYLRKQGALGRTVTDLSRELGVSYAAVRGAVKRYRWADVSDEVASP